MYHRLPASTCTGNDLGRNRPAKQFLTTERGIVETSNADMDVALRRLIYCKLDALLFTATIIMPAVELTVVSACSPNPLTRRISW